MFAWVLNIPLLFEDSLNVLFLWNIIRALIYRHPKILKFQSEAKLEQTIAIVTTHSVFLLGLTSWPVRESALQMLLSRILLLIDVGTGSLSSDSQQWYFAMLMAFSSNWFFHSTSC